MEPVDARAKGVTPPLRAELREVRCRACDRLLCKASELRAGTVEIKCPHCDAMNYLKGRPE